MNIPNDLKYTQDHEWAKQEGEVVVVGITDYAQGELGDVVFVDLPAVGDSFQQGDVFGTIEAVKAAADLYSPVAGEITAVNDVLGSTPETINGDPYGEGWMVKIKLEDSDQLDSLMNAEDYQKHVEES